MEVSSNRDTPKSSIWIQKEFSIETHPAIGVPGDSFRQLPGPDHLGRFRRSPAPASVLGSWQPWHGCVMPPGFTMGKPWDTPDWWPFHASFHGENHGENVEWCLKPICMCQMCQLQLRSTESGVSAAKQHPKFQCPLPGFARSHCLRQWRCDGAIPPNICVAHVLTYQTAQSRYSRYMSVVIPKKDRHPWSSISHHASFTVSSFTAAW